MSRTSPPRYRPRWSLGSGLDALEVRRLLSAATLQIGTDVLSVVPTSLDRVTVTFSPAIDLSLLDTAALDLVSLIDGEPGDSVFAYMPPGPILAANDGSSITFTLGGELEPGDYAILFLGQSGLRFADGSAVDGSDSPMTIRSFQVRDDLPSETMPPGVTLAGAIDLPQLSNAVQTLTGTLDISDPARSVALYRLIVPEGHAFDFGAEVRVAGTTPTDPQILPRLLDASGSPLSILELAGGPQSAYRGLFASLPSGTYYVAISWSENPPASALRPGFDVRTGEPGLMFPGSSPLSYGLHFVASPQATAARVIDARLDRADPLTLTPSGFTLDFSSAVVAQGAVDPETAELRNGVELVGPDGSISLPRLIGYEPGSARLTFLFPTRPAPGRYIVRASSVGGVVDLGGRTPIAEGLAPGEFARLFVPEAAARHPRATLADLGVIYSSPEPTRTLVVDSDGPGASLRFVVPAAGSYSIVATPSVGGLTAVLEGPDGARTIAFGPAGMRSSLVLASASPGAYTLWFSPTLAGRFTLDVQVRADSLAFESVLRNGVGLGSTLDLRLVSITPASSTPGSPRPASPVAGPSVPPVVAFPPTSPPSRPDPIVAMEPIFAAPPIPGGGGASSVAGPIHATETTLATAGSALGEDAGGAGAAGPMSQAGGIDLELDVKLKLAASVMPGNTLVGRPSLPSDSIPAVTGSTSLAAMNPTPARKYAGLLPFGRFSAEDRSGEPAVDPEVVLAAVETGVVVDPLVALPAKPVVSELLERGLAAIDRLFGTSPADPATEPEDRPTDPAPLVASRDAAEEDAEEDAATEMQYASLMEPAGLMLFFAAMAQQGRRLTRRGTRKSQSARKSGLSGPRHGSASPLRGRA